MNEPTADPATLLTDLPAADADAMAAARAREATLTKPAGALGRLEQVSEWLAGWQGAVGPRADVVHARVFAGNHGVVGRGVSAYPPEVTVQMVANFEAGGAAVNQLCEAFNVSLEVVALDLARPTADFCDGPAMTGAEFRDALARGAAAVPAAADLLCVGEMGIGNTTAAAAVSLALYGGDAGDWAGRGTGVDDAGLAVKRRVIAQAVATHGIDPADGLEVLRRLGGRELAAMAGAIVAARRARIPVLLDGFVAGAAAACLKARAADALDHCRAAHVSAEPGHRRLLEKLGMAPLLDLGMRLGEASGAVLAVPVVRAAVACHAGMASFAEAGVSEKGE